VVQNQRAATDPDINAQNYKTRISTQGKIGWPAIAALSAAGFTLVAEALLGWFTNWVDTGGWQANAFIYPFIFTPIGVSLTIIFSVVAGAGFGWKNRVLGIVAGVLPILGVLVMILVTTIPGATPSGSS
jgi:hypothetical protein